MFRKAIGAGEKRSSAIQHVGRLKTSNNSGDPRQRQDHDLTCIIRETVAPDREDGRPTRSADACAGCQATAGSRPEPYLHNTLQGEFVLSATKRVLPEDAWLPARLRPGG